MRRAKVNFQIRYIARIGCRAVRDLLRRTLPGSVINALRAARWARDRIRHRGQQRLRFRCNLCGMKTSYATSHLGREVVSCGWCGSTVRCRAVMYVFTREVLGEAAAVKDLRTRSDLTGLGFSDPSVYSRRLAQLTEYTNSWFHRRPRRDLTNLSTFEGKTYDYLICSEVLEHVDRPVELVFSNLYALLNPGGLLVFTVPVADGETTEHFPPMVRYAVKLDKQGWKLHGQLPDGRDYVARHLRFHGGPGSTLEMRVFGRRSVVSALRGAGFNHVAELVEEDPRFGLVWSGTPESGRPPGVWTARKQ